MRALTPWSGVAALRHEMDRLFDRMWEGELPALPGLAEWAPAVDVSETKDAIVVKAEIPGIDPKEIALALHENVLTIKGQKTEAKEERDTQYYRKERVYGGFTRSLRLPAPVDAGRVTATFKNGVLTVTLPKAPSATGTTIPVTAE